MRTPYQKLQDELIKGDRKFGKMKKKKLDKFQQEQRDLDESYQQSKRNKAEHNNDE